MSNKTKTPIWLDCDPGHDDAFAILLATHHPHLDLQGISTVHGNASLAQTTSNAQRILLAIGRADIPIFAGAARPSSRHGNAGDDGDDNDAIHAVEIHGVSGLDGTDLLPVLPAGATGADSSSTSGSGSGSAVLAMREAILAMPGEVWIIATGALTNLALLFAVFPETARLVAGVSIMGGAIGDKFSDALMGKVEDGEWRERIGNWTAYAEFNIFIDPESAKSVLRHPLLQGKLILIPLDITHLALADTTIQLRLLHGDQTRSATNKGEEEEAEKEEKPHALRQMFYELLTFFSHTYRDVFGFKNGPPLHDPLAVAVVLDSLGQDEFGFGYGETTDEDKHRTQWVVDVITDGTFAAGASAGQLGRTILKRPVNEGEGGVRIPRRIRRLDRFWDCIEEMLQAAEEACKTTGVWER